MLYSYGFVDRKLSPNYANVSVRNNKVVISDCNDEVYRFLCKKWNLDATIRPKFEFYILLEKEMNFEQIEQIAIDHPDDAEHVLLESSRPDRAAIKYLRFLLSKMQGQENRTVDPSWREGFKGVTLDVKKVADELLNPPKEEPVHGFHQEQGQRETADPAQEYSSGNQEN